MKGRVSRQQYILWTIGLSLAFYAFAFGIGFMAGIAGMEETAASSLGFIVGVGYTIVQGFLVVKRLHDLGRPGTHYWLFYVPLYNIYFGLIVLFTKGASGSNEFGPDPSSA
jgi:uncharacterized membrane protein YhaH (DUF805 family)